MRRFVLALVALRFLVAAVLVLSPALDQAAELDGWDVARFQEIHDADGQAYVDFAVEYPPGSLVLIELVTAGSSGPDAVVQSHRTLTVLSLFVDLGIAALLYLRWRPNAALAYLAAGSAMIVFGFTRFDLWAALLGAVGLALSNAAQEMSGTKARRMALDISAASAIAAGALVKLWPALLIVVLAAVGRRRPALLAVGIGGLAGLVWISISGTEAIEQILSLRDATGWQVESVGGVLTSLLGDSGVRYEANAYRIGALNDTLVLLGRFGAVVATLWLSWLASQSTNEQRIPLAMLGSTAALIVTAPLLSPQFLLWLTPWAAMLVVPRVAWGAPTARVFLTCAASVALTAAILSAFGPPNLHETAPALLLLVRNAMLLALVWLAALALRRDSHAQPACG